MKKNQKKQPKQKLNYPQRVIALPHNLSPSEEDRAHLLAYHYLDTLAEYQESFLKREYRKFWFDLPPKEAVVRIDEELTKYGLNVFTAKYNELHDSIIFNIHFAIYEYQNKRFLCPKMIIRDLRDKYQSVVDGAPLLIAPHLLARMLARSGMSFADAIKLLGGVALELMWARGVEKIPCFNQPIRGVNECAVVGHGAIKCGTLELEEPLTCNGQVMVEAGKKMVLFKTWIDQTTLPEDYFDNGTTYKHGEVVQ